MPDNEEKLSSSQETGSQSAAVKYTDDNIKHLSDMEHVRTRPGMYIGRLGDGSLPEDGIYVLLKEVIDNSIDEFKMNSGDRIEVDIDENLRVSVRDYGRGIPQGKLVEAVSMLNTGGKYDSKAFKKSVGLNGVGVKAVNALSSHFEVKSDRWCLNGARKRAIKRRKRRTRTERSCSSSPTIRCSGTTSSTMNTWRLCCETIPISIRGLPLCITDAASRAAMGWRICSSTI